MASPPHTERRRHLVTRLRPHQPLQRFRIVRQLRHERPHNRREGPVARRDPHAAPSFRSGRNDTRAHERSLARPRRANDGKQLALLQTLPQRLDLLLPPEKVRRVLLREARQPGIGAPLLDPRSRRQPRLPPRPPPAPPPGRAPRQSAPHAPSPGTAPRSPPPAATPAAPSPTAPAASRSGSHSTCPRASPSGTGACRSAARTAPPRTRRRHVRASSGSPRTCSGDM